MKDCAANQSVAVLDPEASNSGDPGAHRDEFQPPPPDQVGRLALKGVRWIVVLLAVRQVIGIVSNAVIARLISPRDYGLMAMVVSFTSFAALVTDLGLTWGTVQARDLGRRVLNTLFWFGALVGLLAWGACAAAAPLMARFYLAAEVVPIACVLGANLFLGNLSAQPLALLRRKLRQKTLALLQTLAILAGAGVGIGGAVAGLGYWALVAQALAPPLMLWAAGSLATGFRPGLAVDIRGALSLIGFSGWLAAANMLNYFQLYGDSIAVGFFFGAEAAGLYNRAFYLRTLPALYGTIAFNDVIIPVLSALRGDPGRMAAGYRRAVAAIAFVACPLGGLLGVAAPEAVRLLYGPRWDGAVPILRWLAVAAVALPIQSTGVWLYIAAGRSRGYFLQALALTPLMVGAQLAGVQGGPMGVAAASSLIFAAVVTTATLALSHRAAGIPLRSTLQGIAPAAVATAAAAAGGMSVGWLGSAAGWGWLALLAGKTTLGASLYLGTFAALGGSLPVDIPGWDRWRPARSRVAGIPEVETP